MQLIEYKRKINYGSLLTVYNHSTSLRRKTHEILWVRALVRRCSGGKMLGIGPAGAE